ncbi:hypothetical protein DFA_04379 [Cavenderia fasciculata]|uniref:Uncharacterized protein n=1 Tax=Cavenderia fasciculata TaxID=261658 RepID=F4PPE8_CACFS|nr:uncharacterized protein DFA_04379 [Cavenderia fasciculata]EGG22261.1 hypothetical protein DFA_04379 [Cavenderia fasciculata]|eukprot:XP_004360112.1 hypothetical protein DFA_04379 [Cavenderia fasciculata]
MAKVHKNIHQGLASRLTTEEELKKIQCCNCKEIVDDARQCHKGHLFCYACIQGIANGEKTCKCPADCNVEISLDNLIVCVVADLWVQDVKIMLLTSSVAIIYQYCAIDVIRNIVNRRDVAVNHSSQCLMKEDEEKQLFFKIYKQIYLRQKINELGRRIGPQLFDDSLDYAEYICKYDHWHHATAMLEHGHRSSFLASNLAMLSCVAGNLDIVRILVTQKWPIAQQQTDLQAWFKDHYPVPSAAKYFVEKVDAMQLSVTKFLQRHPTYQTNHTAINKRLELDQHPSKNTMGYFWNQIELEFKDRYPNLETFLPFIHEVTLEASLGEYRKILEVIPFTESLPQIIESVGLKDPQPGLLRESLLHFIDVRTDDDALPIALYLLSLGYKDAIFNTKERLIHYFSKDPSINPNPIDPERQMNNLAKITQYANETGLQDLENDIRNNKLLNRLVKENVVDKELVTRFQSRKKLDDRKKTIIANTCSQNLFYSECTHIPSHVVEMQKAVIANGSKKSLQFLQYIATMNQDTTQPIVVDKSMVASGSIEMFEYFVKPKDMNSTHIQLIVSSGQVDMLDHYVNTLGWVKDTLLSLPQDSFLKDLVHGQHLEMLLYLHNNGYHFFATKNLHSYIQTQHVDPDPSLKIIIKCDVI